MWERRRERERKRERVVERERTKRSHSEGYFQKPELICSRCAPDEDSNTDLSLPPSPPHSPVLSPSPPLPPSLTPSLSPSLSPSFSPLPVFRFHDLDELTTSLHTHTTNHTTTQRTRTSAAIVCSQNTEVYREIGRKVGAHVVWAVSADRTSKEEEAHRCCGSGGGEREREREKERESERAEKEEKGEEEDCLELGWYHVASSL